MVFVSAAASISALNSTGVLSRGFEIIFDRFAYYWSFVPEPLRPFLILCFTSWLLFRSWSLFFRAFYVRSSDE